MPDNTPQHVFAPFPFPFDQPPAKEIRLADFDEFANMASKQANMHGVAWRGLADAKWILSSSAFRAEQKRMLRYASVTGETYHARDLPCIANAVEERMKYASRGLQIGIGSDEHLRLLFRDELLSKTIHDDPERYNELMAIGQHYGLATPLLDVTSSAYVALYFAATGAMELEQNEHTDIAKDRIGIWKIPAYLWQEPIERVFVRDQDAKSVAKNQPTLKAAMKGGAPSGCHGVSISNVFPRIFRSERLAAQQGSFIRVCPDLPLDHVVSVCYDDLGESCFEDQLQLFSLPAGDALLYLTQLEKMNISTRTLFPDMQGHMDSLNLALNHYDYRGTTNRMHGSRFDALGRPRDLKPGSAD